MKTEKYRTRRCIKIPFIKGHFLVQSFFCKVEITADFLIKIFKRRREERESVIITLSFNKTIVNIVSRIMCGLLLIS